MVSLLCHSRPIFPLLFSRKTTTRKKLYRRTKGGYLIPFSHIWVFQILHKVSWYLKQAFYWWRSARTIFVILKYCSIIKIWKNRNSCDHRNFSYFFSQTWRLIYFCVDQSLREVIWHKDKAYLRINIEYNVIILFLQTSIIIFKDVLKMIPRYKLKYFKFILD